MHHYGLEKAIVVHHYFKALLQGVAMMLGGIATFFEIACAQSLTIYALKNAENALSFASFFIQNRLRKHNRTLFICFILYNCLPLQRIRTNQTSYL